MIPHVSFARPVSANLHFRQLQALVQQKVSALPRQRLWFVRIRALLFPLLYFLFYGLAVHQQLQPYLFYLLHIGMGICIVLIFLNLVHEAVHGNLFPGKVLNKSILYIFDLIGANSYIWKKRHTLLHHNFPNVTGWDSDIEQAALFRVFPHDKKKPIHKIQHYLLFLLYPFYLTNWLLIRDFKDFFCKRQIVRKVTKIPPLEYYKLFFFKAIYILYLLVIPVMVGYSVGQVLMAFLLMLLTADVFALLVLLTPHVNIKNEFPLPDASQKIPHNWLMHQFNTTNDVQGSNWFYRNLMANFNLHLAHHLFPHVSYAYAPEVTQIIKEFALSHNLSYRVYSLADALSYHYKLIRQNAINPEILEEDM